jgi:hypothetical protein
MQLNKRRERGCLVVTAGLYRSSIMPSIATTYLGSHERCMSPSHVNINIVIILVIILMKAWTMGRSMLATSRDATRPSSV